MYTTYIQRHTHQQQHCSTTKTAKEAPLYNFASLLYTIWHTFNAAPVMAWLSNTLWPANCNAAQCLRGSTEKTRDTESIMSQSRPPRFEGLRDIVDSRRSVDVEAYKCA